MKKRSDEPSKSYQNPLTKKRFESETSESDINQPPPPAKSLKSKLSTFKIRVISSLIMVLAFILILCAGHFYCCILVLIINICIFKEIISLKRNQQREAKLPYFYIINWYFFCVTELLVTSIFLSNKMILSRTINVTLMQKLLVYEYLVMFCLFVFGIMLFVVSLRKGQYKYQFSMFAWTIVTCVLVVTQSTAVILNIYEGIIWLLLPASLVIINDCTAYIFGVFFGRTPLIKISPNKTVEGFIGGLVSTIVWAYFVRIIQFSQFLANFEHLICSQDYITMVPFVFNSCDSSDLLLRLPRNLYIITLNLSSLEINAMVLGFFAGFIAPFGGFFASGVKRAFKIKDFGDSIPGHGGMTDRMDCQIMMGMFTCVWIHTMLTTHNTSIENIITQISLLSYSDQLQILNQLRSKFELENFD